MKRLIFTSVLLGIVAVSWSQERMISAESTEQRRSVVRSIPPDQQKTEATQLAESKGIPVRIIMADKRIREVRLINEFGNLEYYTTLNRNAAKTVSTDKLWPGAGYGYSLTGKGIVVGVWDAGVLRSTHVEFEDRARIMNEQSEVEGHPTHVCGTIGAKGLDERAAGMAPEVTIEAYNWDRDIQEMDAAAADGLLISNHSYGFVNGWDYNLDESRWEWYGELSISKEEDYLFGFYHKEASDYDRVSYKHPYYLIVKSAGNDRGDGPPPGSEHYVWQNGDWTLSTDIRQDDGGSDGFDCMSPVANAKNIISVGAIKDLPLGFTGPENVKLDGFSAFGPTDDGRIKPDLVANGDELYSTYSGSDTDYATSSGTSMSSPNVAGSLALIQQQHFSLYNSYLTSSALKGLVLHTADDALNPGPDYMTGWGVMNTLAAVELISDQSFDRVIEDSLSEGGEFRLWLYSNGTKPIRVTICWTDPPGTVPAASLDPVDRILVNDLDLRVMRETDSHIFRPYVLDPLNPASVAVTGDNQLDNVEQVYIESPQKGFYELTVTHKGSLAYDKQNFSLIVTGLTDEYFASGLEELNHNNGEFQLTSASEYIPEMDASWIISPENGKSIKLYFDYFDTESLHDAMAIFDGTDSTAPYLGQLSGDLNTDTVEFNSSSGNLFVSFRSDGQIQKRGFRALYCTTVPEEVPQIQGDTFPCANNRSGYLATGVFGADFTWDPPGEWVIDSVISDWIQLTPGSGKGALKVTAVNRCGIGMESEMLISPLESAPSLATYSADTIPCAGTETFAEVPFEQGSVYDWKLPANWLGSSSNHRLEYIPGYEPGDIRVIAQNSCGNGDTVFIPVNVQNIPGEVQILTTKNRPCELSEQSFFVVTIPDHQYTWEVQDDWSIIDDSDNDTVIIRVGSKSSFLYLDVSNKCGSRKSSKLFLTSPAPDDPLLQLNTGDFKGYYLLSISNAQVYSDFQWYRNDTEIESRYARRSDYVAYLPGIYTVSVSNQEGCSKRVPVEDGFEIQQPNQVYSVFQGAGGNIVILNSTNATALVNIYHFSGKIEKITTIGPGYNEIPWDKEGAFIITVSGSGDTLSTRIFTSR